MNSYIGTLSHLKRNACSKNVFLTFSNIFEKCLWFRFVYLLTVFPLTPLKILGLPYIWYKLLMICIYGMFSIESKMRSICSLFTGALKRISLWSIRVNHSRCILSMLRTITEIMKRIWTSQVYWKIFSVEYGILRTYHSFTGLHKKFQLVIGFGLWFYKYNF